MKEFRTELKVVPSKARIELKSGMITQGSCFSDAIGDRLSTFKLRTLVNPFGVIYNPESIHKVLHYSLFNEPVPDHTYLRHEEINLNYNFHSEFSSPGKQDLAVRLLNTIGATHDALKDCEWLLLTYGTAWIYKRKDTGETVANCHKQPGGLFTKILMTADQIVESFSDLLRDLKKFNPDIKIILTVSPVRHLKDTLELNQVSKSILRVACHRIQEEFEMVDYFPGYEMMMDDLRDYRFYRSDMIHPTTDAEDYIWQKFMERYFSSSLQDFVEQWRVILSAIRHKPFHPETAAHQHFLRETLRKLDQLGSDVDVREERALIQQQLNKEKNDDRDT
jgi:hypothetical protein